MITSAKWIVFLVFCICVRVFNCGQYCTEKTSWIGLMTLMYIWLDFGSDIWMRTVTEKDRFWSRGFQSWDPFLFCCHYYMTNFLHVGVQDAPKCCGDPVLRWTRVWWSQQNLPVCLQACQKCQAPFVRGKQVTEMESVCSREKNV